ncbi:hypothetical protein Tco_0321800, partial [Tanacetum coccineum]
MESQLETTQTVSTLKLPVLKTREYDLWSMRMKQYLTFTDLALWEVIVNGDSVSPITSASADAEGPIPAKTAEQKLARKNELKAKSTLMLAIPDEHLLKFHACKDTNLPSAWSNIALIMRNKSDLDTFSMDDLYNNLKVYESEIKGQTSSSLNSQNVAFVSSNNSSSTNETVNTAHSVSAASSKDQASTASYADDVMFSFFANQSNAPQLDNEDLEQIDADDLEEMNLKLQVAMLTMRVKRAPRNQGNINRDDPRRNASVDTSTTNVLVVQDGIGYQMGLESLEARIVVHEKNEAIYEENIAFLKYDVQVKDISIKDLKNHAKDKIGLGYDIHVNESEVVHSLFNSRESDVDDNPVNDRFKIVRKTTTSVPETETSMSKTSKNIIEKPKTVRPSAPIIEEWDTYSDNDSVFRPKSDQTKSKFTKINFVKSDNNVKFV